MVEDVWAGTIGKYWEVARPELQGFGEFPLGRMRFFHNGQHNTNIQPKNQDILKQFIDQVKFCKIIWNDKQQSQ